MWKRIVISIIALIGSFSVGYAYYSSRINAALAYTTGGNVTGRVNIAPSNLSGTKTNIGMKKGDRYYLGKNLPGDGSFIGWQLITDAIEAGSVQESSWLAFTNDPIKNEAAFDSPPTYYQYDTPTTKVPFTDGATAPFDESNVFNTMNVLNGQWSSAKYNTIIGTRLKDRIENNRKSVEGKMSNPLFFQFYTWLAETIRTASFGKNAFLMPYLDAFYASYEVSLQSTVTPAFALTDEERKFTSKGINYNYFTELFYECASINEKIQNSVLAVNGTNGGLLYESNTITMPLAVRPAIFIQKDNIVFGTSSSSGSGGLTFVSEPNLPGGYSNITTDAVGNAMKIRYYDSSMSITLDSNLMNSSGSNLIKKGSSFQTAADTTIQLKANGNSTVANSVVSALLFDQSGRFVAYAPLGNATGSMNNYMLDLSGLATGMYQLAVVNEEYDSVDLDVAKSSLISNVIPLEIVEPISDLSFIARSSLEVNNNVNVGNTVGTISSNHGAGTPIYAIIADPAYPNEYQSVELASDGKTVVVKGSALHAGTYHFKIQAQDENGNPDPALEINASITVGKNSLSVAFVNPNQTKKSITDATAGWSETGIATPSINTKLRYTKSGGSVGLINMDPDTGMITYTGSGGYGKVTIKATADDDPSTGYDDYNSADTTKEIVIYREVDGNVTPHANSSSTSSPIFQTSDANVKPNGTIGNIIGTLGTPDNGISGMTTYTYGLKIVDDYNFFSVNPNTGEIKTTADLSTTTGTYHITVTVSDKWSTKEIPVTINVGLAGAEDLKFYETTAAIKAITSKSVKVTDTGVNVYATVKGSSNTNPVTYRLKSGEPTNVIDVHPNSGAVTMKGVGTVIIVAEKAGGSGQADASTELAFTVTAGEQNFIYTDDVGDELPKSGSYYSVYKETYAPSKTFQLYTSGNPTGSTVTYQLKAGSPSDVISVDPSGLVTIQNASLTAQKGKVIVQATSHDPGGNYSDKTIELPIDIDKGTRTIAFADHPITVVSGSGSVAPNILADGVLDTSGTAMIEIDSSEDNSIAWTSDGITVQYSWNDVNGKDIKLHVTKPTDRNYKEAKADGTLHILGADESSLTINSPGKITYGDHFTIRSTQDDSASSNVQYSFTSDNAVFISAPTVTGNKAEFDAIGNSGSTEITITITRTADGEVPLSKAIKIKVLPKPITIQIDDKEKKRLEDNPPLTFQDITPQLVSWGGVKDNVDTSILRLNTTAKKYSPIGSYPITCKNDTTLNDNYPNYTFTLKEGKLNVTDNGNKDFWDIDDDGCPDLNIQIKDADGNTITINGDANEDGIPDYNIDSNGDGKPDLNIDTDKDGKPDVNLVILKEWKPSKCVTLGDIQYSSGITAKPKINVDTDNDLIPEIDLDTDGDFKADFNIDTDGDRKANVNIGKVHTPWKPESDYTYQGFRYDTMKQDQPLLNIDTDDDGSPDVNLDLDGDGTPDLNIDHDGDLIPDTDIDSTGDGKADINIDTNGDGLPDENIKEITEWKPEHNVDGAFPYDTMKFDEPKQPGDDSNNEDNNGNTGSEVKGNYYPGANTGGALTGDTTEAITYIEIGCISLGLICFILFKRKQGSQTKLKDIY